MALCTVSGTIRDINGVALPLAKVTFRRANVLGQDDDVITSDPITVTANGSGVISVELYPGLYETRYRSGRASDAFTTSVPDQLTANLADLIDQAAPIIASAADIARDKAREWATNPEDDPVETGEFSALHWAAKAADSAAAAAEDGAEAGTGAATTVLAEERAKIDNVSLTGSRSLLTTDAGKMLTAAISGDITLTIPTDDTNLPVETIIGVWRIGSGAVTLAAASGVTLVTTDGLFNLGQGSTAIVYKIASNSWAASGYFT